MRWKPRLRQVLVILVLIAFALFMLSVAVGALTPRPSVSCFVGRIIGVDTTRSQHAFMIQFMESVPPVNDSSWASPVMPYVLVCSRFPADGAQAEAKP